MDQFLDIENVATRDDAIQELRQHFSRMFNKVESSQDYAKESITNAFANIGKEVPQIVWDAHNILNKRPHTPLDRSEILDEMLGIAEQLSAVYAEWDRFIDQLELVVYPASTIEVEGKVEKLLADERKLRKDAKIAPFKAVRDILFYMLSFCAKTGPSMHQTILNFERDLMRQEGIHQST